MRKKKKALLGGKWPRRKGLGK